MKYKILILNAIAEKGLQTFDPKKYQLEEKMTQPDAIMVRSASMHDLVLPESVKIVGRAGAGVNNIPVKTYTSRGIPVLNAPGANANAVKELVIAGMLLACRNICAAWNYSQQLEGDDEAINLEVEKNKKRFSGTELPEKTLGVIGLGNIGVKVANAAIHLGMKVIGFDNLITVQNAWQLSANVEQAQSIAEVCAKADFITVHVPLSDGTRNLINSKLFRLMKNGTVLLNFARNGIVNNEDLIDALASDKIGSYVCDFPSKLLSGNPKVIALPHLGASTREAEENCAVMVARNIQNYLENGAIKNSVNFPNIALPKSNNPRIAIINRNVPNIIAQITTALSNQHTNILDMINKSRDDIAYNLLDIDTVPTDDILKKITAIDGIISVRKI